MDTSDSLVYEQLFNYRSVHAYLTDGVILHILQVLLIPNLLPPQPLHTLE